MIQTYMMKKACAIALVIGILLAYPGCRGKKKNDVFPALDFIKGQIANVDTSLYPIIKLVPTSDSTYDTTYVKREDFKTLAKDFVETPDISKSFGGQYTEERMMNNELGLAVFIATPKDDNLEVRRQEVRITPNPPDDRVQSIYIERLKSDNDSSTLKRMTWYTDKKFQIVTITQKKNGPEKNSVMEVVWNDKENY